MFSNPRIGLQNHGDTCYINACLQIFLACHTTRHHVEAATFSMPSLAKLFKRISCTRAPYVSPLEFIYTLPMEYHPCSGQHDAAEMLLHILSNVADSHVQRTFAHAITVHTKCKGCDAASTIASNDFIFALTASSTVRTIEEEVVSSQMPHLFERVCETCACPSSTQTITLLPSGVLLIQIKRFSYNMLTGVTSKLYEVVRISHRLTFASVPYELRVVLLHSGDFSSGHYIVDVLDTTGERLSISDHTTEPIPHARPSNVTPYVLMYVRL